MLVIGDRIGDLFLPTLSTFSSSTKLPMQDLKTKNLKLLLQINLKLVSIYFKQLEINSSLFIF